jgi:hypothetical protein
VATGAFGVERLKPDEPDSIPGFAWMTFGTTHIFVGAVDFVSRIPVVQEQQRKPGKRTMTFCTLLIRELRDMNVLVAVITICCDWREKNAFRGCTDVDTFVTLLAGYRGMFSYQ